MLSLSSLQSDPGMAFVDGAFLSNPQGTMKAHLKAWFKSGRPKPPGWAYVRYWIGPLKALTFSFAKPTTDFTFTSTLGTIMHLLLLPHLFPTSLYLSPSLSFPHLLYCVSGRSTASVCFESFSFHRESLGLRGLQPLGKDWDVIFDILQKTTRSICLS